MITDFKTDVDQPDRQSRYRRQVGWYVHTHRKAMRTSRRRLSVAICDPVAIWLLDRIELTADARMTNAHPFVAIRTTHQQNC